MIIFDFFDAKGRMVDENSLLYHFREMIMEVVISPHGDVGMQWRTVRFLLDKYKMNWCVLEKSVLPYNGR